MRKLLYTGALFLSALFLQAQSVQDGLNYGIEDNLYGTARFRGLSGAFGALGGDLSAMGINPAGSVIFNNHYIGFTVGNNFKSNEATYFNNATQSSESDFDLNQFGGVMVFKSVEGNTLSRFAIGLNYDRTRNYQDQLYLQGESNRSIANYFVENANGISLDNFETIEGESVADLYQFLGENNGFSAQQGLLGFQSFIINPLDPSNLDNTQYVSATGSGSFSQRYQLFNFGSQSKTSINFAGEINNKWSLGINLNGHTIDYTQFKNFRELNSNANATTTDIEFNNVLETTAAGFSFQMGAIGKITESLRIGATYQSPTWYRIEEALSQEIFTTRIEDGGNQFVDLPTQITNIYAPYTLKTPAKFTGSIAYVFSNKGLISMDYSTIDYSTLEFKDDNASDFDSNNIAIGETLGRTSTFRIGGEYRLGRLTLRGGYRNIGSPYEDLDFLNNAQGYSLGLGYSFGPTILNISYDNSTQNYTQQLYNNGLTTTGRVQNDISNIVIGLGFNF